MNASFTEKKYESSYACIAASILGMRSKNGLPQNRSKKEAARELLTVLVLFILTNNKGGGHHGEKTSTRRDLFTLSCDVSCVSVFICVVFFLMGWFFCRRRINQRKEKNASLFFDQKFCFIWRLIIKLKKFCFFSFLVFRAPFFRFFFLCLATNRDTHYCGKVFIFSLFT